MKTALVITYYGTLPPYFNHFMRSVDGRLFDVLLVTDLEIGPHPDNLRVARLSFDEFVQLAGRKLGVEPRLASIRRICDFKPMYGKIFEDFLAGYDYWAFGDCDMVFGPLFDKELTAALDSDVDVFSTQEHFTAGPFCMLRNDERCKMLFAQADNWRDVITFDGTNCIAFDELSGDFHDEVRHGKMTIEDCRAHCDSFSAVVRRAPGMKLKFKDMLYQNSLADGSTVEMMFDGILTAGGEPIAAYHFVRAKLRRYFTYVHQDYDDIGLYIIDDAGFYVTLNQIRFRKIFNMKRKLLAAVKSLAVNGLDRFVGKHK